MMRASCFVTGLSTLLLLIGGRFAHAQCTYPALGSGVAATASDSSSFYQFNQTQRFWTAVAVRPAPGDDWNLAVHQATDVAPNCVTGLLASSEASSGVDLIVGDFNVGHNALGLHYPASVRALGAGDAVVEWDAGANVLLVNAPLTERSTGAGDVVEIWDAQLNAGVTYTLHFAPTGADLKLLVFKSGAGAYWAGRGAALVETAVPTTFVPPSTGFYGIAVVNDDGAAGGYRVGIGRCDTPTPLVAGTAVTTSLAEKYYSFDQSATFWTAVGARGAADWNVDAYATGSGGAWPVCFSGAVAGSAAAAPAVDFVVGNFNSLLIGTHYARVHLQDGVGTGSATVEWDSGFDVLTVDSTTVNGTTGPADVLQVWDVFLDRNTTYHFTLEPTGGAMKLFLFSPQLPGSWGARGDAVFQMDGAPGAVAFTADTTDWHAVVVTNEDGGSGTYVLRVGSSLVAVDDPALPNVTELQRVVPNPARGPLNLAFALQRPSAVTFDVVNVAGRIVAETPPNEWPAGRWTYRWDGRTRSGARPGPGVYFVRMKADDRVIAQRKVVLLD